MSWKVCGALAALLMVIGVSGSSAVVPLVDPEPGLRLSDAAFSDYAKPATIPFPDDNPYTPAKAVLGRTLFFDPVLSGPGTRACVSCHLPQLGWGDGRARASHLKGGSLDLRTPTLLDLAWQERMGWDGKFHSIEDVPFSPITGAGNMNLPEREAVARLAANPAYTAAFADAFGDPAVTRPRIEAALATFVRLIVSGPAPFDAWIAGNEGALDPQAKRGFALFNGRARCAACHSGWSFSDGSFHDIGTAAGGDTGRGRFFPTSAALRYAFKTPGLRNLAQRAPYMHDGSVPTLAAVIEHYDRGGIARPSRSPDIRPLNLTPGEKADLLAFLQSLDGVPNPLPLADPLPEVAPGP